MTVSLVPAVLDKLVELATEAVKVVPVGPGEPGVTALDGPSRGSDLPRKYLVIGWSGQPDTQGVQSEIVDQGAARRWEVIDVRGAVSISRGDDGQKTVRDQAYAVLDALATAIGARLDVNKVVRTRLSQHALEPFTGNGAGCTLMFTIHIEGNC